MFMMEGDVFFRDNTDYDPQKYLREGDFFADLSFLGGQVDVDQTRIDELAQSFLDIPLETYRGYKKTIQYQLLMSATRQGVIDPRRENLENGHQLKDYIDSDMYAELFDSALFSDYFKKDALTYDPQEQSLDIQAGNLSPDQVQALLSDFTESKNVVKKVSIKGDHLDFLDEKTKESFFKKFSSLESLKFKG